MRFKKIKSVIELVSLGIGFKTITKCAYGQLQERELHSIFEKFSRSYQRSADALLENAQNNTPDIFNNMVFHLASIGTSVLFGYRGDYENAQKISRFALDNIPTKNAKAGPEVPGMKKEDLNVFEKLIISYELRLVAMQIEKETPSMDKDKIHKNHYSREIADKLEVIKASLYNNKADKTTQTPGELALLYFITGDQEKSKDMLETLYTNAENTTKLLLPEVFENLGFAQVAPIVGQAYIDFAQAFIDLKQEQAPQSTNKNKPSV